MTTNKPEVVAWFYRGTRLGDQVYKSRVDSLVSRVDSFFPSPHSEKEHGYIKGDPLIRLSEYEALQAECGRLRKALVEARDLVAEWGDYASDYFKEKHGLERDIARLDAVISGEE